MLHRPFGLTVRHDRHGSLSREAVIGARGFGRREVDQTFCAFSSSAAASDPRP